MTTYDESSSCVVNLEIGREKRAFFVRIPADAPTVALGPHGLCAIDTCYRCALFYISLLHHSCFLLVLCI